MLQYADRMRCTPFALLVAALAIGACGGGSGESATTLVKTAPAGPTARNPSSLTAADLQRGAPFYAVQPEAGQLVLVRICKSRVAAEAARREDVLSNSYSASSTVQDVDADGLRRTVGRALAAAHGTTIAEVCKAKLAAAVAKARAASKRRAAARNSPAAKRKRAEAENAPDPHQVAIRKLLREKGAVGKSRSAVREALGRPDSTQDIGGEVIWYYETSANNYQVTFVNGVVDQVNRYGK
jgi:hypothetical protein